MKSSTAAGFGFGLFAVYASVIALAVWGYVWNIIKIIGALSDPTVSAMFIARCVGVFAMPLGAILGFF